MGLIQIRKFKFIRLIRFIRFIRLITNNLIVHRELEQRLHELVATQSLVNNLKTFEDGQWVGSQVGATG